MESHDGDRYSWNVENQNFKAEVYFYSHCNFFCKLDLMRHAK